MIISEKGLDTCLKRAYKRTGYTIMEHDDGLIIYTDDWFICLPWSQMPRRALGTIVEHVGLDVIGPDAIHVYANDEPQGVMPDVIGADLEAWRKQGTGRSVARVPVTVYEQQLYQAIEKPLRCYALSPESLMLISPSYEKIKATLYSESLIVWENKDSGEVISIRAKRPCDVYSIEDDESTWSKLETLNLRKFDP